jgi:hypothetical protein
MKDRSVTILDYLVIGWNPIVYIAGPSRSETTELQVPVQKEFQVGQKLFSRQSARKNPSSNHLVSLIGKFLIT